MKVCYLEDQILQHAQMYLERFKVHREVKVLKVQVPSQIPRFDTPKFVQGLEVDLDEHNRAAIMFQ
jgi:hypothetical protein